MATIKVCKYFIKSSPVGELKEVLDDVSNVLGSSDFLSTPEIKEALREYYESHKLHLRFPNGETALVAVHGRQEPIVRYAQVEESTYQHQQQQPVPQAAAPKKGGLFDGDDEDEYGAEKAEEQQEEAPVEQYEQQESYNAPVQQQESIEEFVYYDPVKKIKFSFDPYTLEAKIEQENVDWETETLSTNVVQLRDDIVKAMNSYLNRQFRKGTTEFGVYASYDGSQITVEISCHNLNFKSFWGGEWLSSWVIDVASQTISGSIKVHNHYFEQGNIQFNLNKDIPSTKLKTLAARQIVDFISNSETNYQEGLDEMYTEVSEKLLKGMRRIMPITRTKFDWTRPNLL